MVFTSIYSVVDGFFVSNFAGDMPFKAINIIFPIIMVLGAVGFMMGAGGNAVVSKTMGEGDDLLAKQRFTLITFVTAALGAVLAVAGFFLARPLSVLIGATGEILDHCVLYMRILMCSLPFFALQNQFQSIFMTAEKPVVGFAFTLASGIANIVLDATFVAWFGWGLKGAAIATAISQFLGGALPIVYFACKNSSRLRFVRLRWDGKVLLKTCVNGSSELLGNVSASIVSILYNLQLLKLTGEGGDGVAAYGVALYVQFVFIAIFIGYCLGVAPIVGYNFGARNKAELQNIFKKSMLLLSACALVMTALCFGLARPVSRLFVGYSDALTDMTTRCLRWYSLSFLFCGFNMFCSSFFTALNNGLVSAMDSFGRTLVFQLLCILVLPQLLGLDGVWLATPIAELLSLLLSLLLFAVCNRRYGYVARGKRAKE